MVDDAMKISSNANPEEEINIKEYLDPPAYGRGPEGKNGFWKSRLK